METTKRKKTATVKNTKANGNVQENYQLTVNPNAEVVHEGFGVSRDRVSQLAGSLAKVFDPQKPKEALVKMFATVVEDFKPTSANELAFAAFAFMRVGQKMEKDPMVKLLAYLDRARKGE